MKKLLSLLLSLVLAIVLIPVSALPVYAASQLSYIGIKYDVKSVAVRTGFTEKEISEALAGSLVDMDLEGLYYDTTYTFLVKKEGTSYIRLKDSSEPISAENEYYFLFNIENETGYEWDEENLPAAYVNGEIADDVRWYGGSPNAEGSVDVYKRVYISNGDFVSNVKITPSEARVQKGKSYQFAANVIGTQPAVTWNIGGGTSASTRVDNSGRVIIGSDETASWLTLTATSVFNPLKSGAAEIEVLDDSVYISSVVITPENSSVKRNDSIYIDADVEGTDYHDLIWTVTGNNDPDTAVGGNSNGATLRIAAGETANVVTVKAEAKQDPSKYDTADITILSADQITAISIVYDESAVVLNTNTTGKEVTDALVAALDDAPIGEGSYIDQDYVYLTYRSGDRYISLKNSTELLSEDQEYYFCFNIEEYDGYVFNTSVFPSITVNGAEPDDVRWYGGSASLTGSLDVYKRAVLGDVSDYWYVTYDANGGSGTMGKGIVKKGQSFVVPECSFTAPNEKVFDHWECPEYTVWGNLYSSDTLPIARDITLIAVWRDIEYSFTILPETIPARTIKEGYGWYAYYEEITIENTGEGDLKLFDDDTFYITSSNEIFKTWAAGCPHYLEPGSSHTRSLQIDTGLQPGLYTTTLTIQDVEKKASPVAMKASVIVEGEIDKINLMNVKGAYAGNKVSDYDYSAITTYDTGYSVSTRDLQWCEYNEAYGYFTTFNGTFELGKEYYLRVEVNADQYYTFSHTSSNNLSLYNYYVNGERVTPEYEDYYFNGRDWLCFYVPFTVTKSESDLPAAKVSGTLSLADSIDIIMTVHSLSDTSDISKYTVAYSFAGEEAVVKRLGTDIEADTDGRFSTVVASCAAKQLTDTVTLIVMYDGDPIKTVSGYSAQTYCNNTIAKHSTPGDSVASICRAVLEYGADAQVFFDNYNSDNMANAVYNDTASVSAIVIPNNWKSTSTGDKQSAGLSKVSATLDLVSRTELLFYLTPNGSQDEDDYTVSVKDLNLGTYSTITKEMQSDGRILIRVKGIYAKYLGHMFELSISDGNGTYTVKYSPMTFAYSKQQNGAENLRTLVKALYNYYIIAENFFD